jgi:hypothetical protein
MGQLRIFFGQLCQLWQEGARLEAEQAAAFRAERPFVQAPDTGTMELFRSFFALPAEINAGLAVGTQYGDWRISDTAGLVVQAVPVFDSSHPS